jgi:hypothetical protein
VSAQKRQGFATRTADIRPAVGALQRGLRTEHWREGKIAVAARWRADLRTQQTCGGLARGTRTAHVVPAGRHHYATRRQLAAAGRAHVSAQGTVTRSVTFCA